MVGGLPLPPPLMKPLTSYPYYTTSYAYAYVHTVRT